MIALIHFQTASHNLFIEQYLDINFMVRAVDAASIIYKVGVSEAAIKAEFNPRPLGHAQIATFTKHLTAQLTTINAQAVIGPVTHLQMALCRGFHIGTNTAVPYKINLRFKQCGDQLGRRQLILIYIKSRLNLRCQLQRLS